MRKSFHILGIMWTHANGHLAMSAIKAHARCRELVDVRSLCLRGPVAAEFRAQVIHGDEEDVGTGLVALLCGSKEAVGNEEAGDEGFHGLV